MKTQMINTTAELIGADETVAQNQWSDSVQVTLGAGNRQVSGEILGFALVSKGGAILTPAGQLVIFDSDPSLDVGDTALAGASFDLIIGKFNVEEADYHSGTNGAIAYFNTPMAFQGLGSFFAGFFYETATSINSATGDDETLDVRFVYRLEG